MWRSLSRLAAVRFLSRALCGGSIVFDWYNLSMRAFDFKHKCNHRYKNGDIETEHERRQQHIRAASIFSS